MDELIELLERQAVSVRELERRVRTVECLVVAGEHRFLGLAVDELQDASEELAALELARALALVAAGLDPDTRADDLADVIEDEPTAEHFRAAVDALRTDLEGLTVTRARARRVCEVAVTSVDELLGDAALTS